MQKNQFRVCLYVVVFGVSLVITLSENNSKFIKFTKESDLSGFICPEQHAIYFKDKMSVSQCLATCADAGVCFGVFRHEESSRCIGCRDKFITRENAPTLLGTTFYRHRYYLVVTNAKTWTDAKNHCLVLGGHLVDIKSPGEDAFIEKLLESENFHVWIGATDVKTEGVFIWQDGSSVRNYFQNWEDGEPNNSGGNEHCVVSVNSVRKWYDVSCDRQYRSVCELD